MDCEVCGKRMSSWNEESWGRVERVYECNNPNCGEESGEDEE
jgi:hypothetical protein